MSNIVISELQKEKSRLEYFLKKIEKNQSHEPEGSIRIVKTSETNLAFYCRAPGSKGSGRYIPKHDNNRISLLLQKKYDNIVSVVIKEQLDAINRFLSLYDISKIGESLSEINALCRDYIEIYEYPEFEFVKLWKSGKYQSNPHPFETNGFVTAKGELVRSKSELIIANTLNDAKIPYRYEYPLTIGEATVYPDFTILDVKNKREILWEHCGKMAGDAYRSSLYWKIDKYAQIGITIGHGLILSFEDYQKPLNTNTIKQMIKNISIL